MTRTPEKPVDRLDEIIEEFGELEVRERLELLLDFSEQLPPLPERYEALKESGENRVHECQTPVYMWIEPEDGVVRIYADVAPEAPTVKGFVAILVEAFSGARPEDILQVPPTVIQRMGLAEALGMVRMRGFSGLMNRIRSDVQKIGSDGASAG